jgi:hypothetical protein
MWAVGCFNGLESGLREPAWFLYASTFGFQPEGEHGLSDLVQPLCKHAGSKLLLQKQAASWPLLQTQRSQEQQQQQQRQQTLPTPTKMAATGQVALQ